MAWVCEISVLSRTLIIIASDEQSTVSFFQFQHVNVHSTDQTYRLLYGLLEYAPYQSALSLKAYHYRLHFSAFMIIKQGKCLPFTCSQ